MITQEQLTHTQAIRNWMSEQGVSQAQLARLAHIKPGTLSQVINDKYPTDASKWIAQIQQAIADYQPTGGGADTVVETSVYKLVHTACQMAVRNKNFAVCAAYVGTGKTFAAKAYAAAHNNAHLIEADPTMTTGVFVDALMQALALPPVRTVAAKFANIVKALKGSNSLLIVDEAETLTPKVLHLVRRLRDKAEIGVVMLGTEYLSGLIQPEHGQFDQIRSRVGFWPKVMQSISRDDCTAVVQAQLLDASDDVTERLWTYCKGSIRLLAEGLIPAINTYRKDKPLDVALVDSIATQALTLQPITIRSTL